MIRIIDLKEGVYGINQFDDQALFGLEDWGRPM